MLKLDQLLPFPGFHGTAALAHIRVYEQPDGSVVVIVGELTDNPSTSVTNAIEAVAEQVYKLVGQRRPYRLFEHYPDHGGPGEFDEVTFTGTGGRPGATVMGVEPDGSRRPIRQERSPDPEFTGPKWKRLSHVEIEALVGEPVQTWEPGQYVAANVGGPAGAQRLAEQQAASERASADMAALFSEFRV